MPSRHPHWTSNGSATMTGAAKLPGSHRWQKASRDAFVRHWRTETRNASPGVKSAREVGRL
eukprot:5683121-Lingulodinium_polyedra.AAC.1